mmetsp:Transcript_37626/g.58742  ORF Transcript_37626/g.58742 Transcript_37626/m.58742 type:complete len:223 (-) Transcript_37626:103-771(-)
MQAGPSLPLKASVAPPRTHSQRIRLVCIAQEGNIGPHHAGPGLLGSLGLHPRMLAPAGLDLGNSMKLCGTLEVLGTQHPVVVLVCWARAHHPVEASGTLIHCHSLKLIEVIGLERLFEIGRALRHALDAICHNNLGRFELLAAGVQDCCALLVLKQTVPLQGGVERIIQERLHLHPGVFVGLHEPVNNPTALGLAFGCLLGQLLRFPHRLLLRPRKPRVIIE